MLNGVLYIFDSIWGFVHAVWIFITNENNRAVLGWIGGGIVVIAGGIWAA
jgi:hypothetical protein